MPDEPKVDLAPTWKQVIRDICQAIIALASIAGIWLANHNSDKINAVQNTQQEVKQETTERAQEVKQEVTARANKIDAEAERQRKAAAEEAEKQRKATAAMLYGNWVYLRDNGYTDEAANAKKRYDEFNGKK